MTQASEVLPPPEEVPPSGVDLEEAPTTWHYLVLLGLLRASLTYWVGRAGVTALSDDDYARVTIAQSFSVHAKLDPSGTSWLPLPFWTTGTLMKLLDPSLDVARLATTVFAILATWLLFAAGRACGFSDKQSFATAAMVNAIPAAAVLGSVTVPEFPTAALCVFAVVAMTRPAPSSPVWSWGAAAAMLAATWSRYEAWPIAAVVAFFAFRRADHGSGWKRYAVTALCLVGPAAWILHNQIAHGDALSFLHRVASYRAALAQHAPTKNDEETSYLWALVVGSPAVLLAVLGPILLWLRRDRAEARQQLARYRPWAIAAAALVVFLLAGQFLGGAPTHHPERTLLVVWMLAAFVAVDLAWHGRAPRWLALPVLALLALDYRVELTDSGFHRDQEELAGSHLHALVPAGQRVFIATPDYGYFAVMAAWARPSDTAYETRDPRAKTDKPLLADRWNAPARLKAENAQWLVAPSGAVFPLSLRERSHVGSLVIYELDATR
jgi:hypothetical protein